MDSDPLPDPPSTARESTTERLHGVEIADPYRWLEADDDRVASWTERQNAYTDAVLGAEPDEGAGSGADGRLRTWLRDRFFELSQSPDYGAPTPAGGRLFQLVREAGAEQPALVVRDGPAGEARVLADPETWGADGPASIDWFVPDPDGAHVAFGAAPGGTEQYDVSVLDVETGETIDEVPDIGRGGGRGFAWTDDGFFYTRTGSAGVHVDDEAECETSRETPPERGAADGQLDKEVRFHELGTDPGTDRLVVDGVRDSAWPVLEASDGVLVVEFSSGWDRSDVFALDVERSNLTGSSDTLDSPNSPDSLDSPDSPNSPNSTDPEVPIDLHPVLTGHDAVFAVTLEDGICYVRTDYGAPNSRLLATPVDELVGSGTGESDAADPDALVEVLPERDSVLQDVAVDGDRLVARSHRDARAVLEVFDLETGSGEAVPTVDRGVGGESADGGSRTGGTERAGDCDGRIEVDLDPFSTVGGLAAADGLATFTEQSFTSPSTVRSADLEAGTVETLQATGTGFDLDVTVTQEWFESADGTPIPAFVVRRTGVESDGDNPTVLTGYGGFRVDRTPTFDPYLEPFLEAGGVFVLATLRGGTEYGEAWHEAGRRERKQHVFDDFLAVAEGLVNREWTTTDRLGITGGSNGGLLVGAALTQRPDLFGAVCCRVPLLDMLRFHRFLLGASWTSEYGSPADPTAFEYLRDYSPYHNVERTNYPATLLSTATGDTRVHPSHARKMAARLQARTTGEDPILLRVRGETGHGVGKPRSMVVDEQAENWAFLLRFLDVDVTPNDPTDA